MTAKEVLETIVDLTAMTDDASEEQFEAETILWNPDRYGEPFGVVEIPSRRPNSNKNNNLDLTSIETTTYDTLKKR